MPSDTETFIGLVLGAGILGQNNTLADKAVFVAAPFAIAAAAAAGAAAGAAEHEGPYT